MLCFVVYRQDSTNGQILRSQGESKKFQWSAEATKCVVPTEILRPDLIKSGIERGLLSVEYLVQGGSAWWGLGEAQEIIL